MFFPTTHNLARKLSPRLNTAIQPRECSHVWDGARLSRPAIRDTFNELTPKECRGANL
jgi:hypothetical protein